MTTFALTVTAEPNNVPPRVRLDVTTSGTPVVTSVNVMRSDANGASVPVRTNDGGPLTLTVSGSSYTATVYDYEIPYGQSSTYTLVESSTTVTASVKITTNKVWLIHLGIPDRSIPVTVAELGSRTRQVIRGVFYPMGRAAPVVISDGQRKTYEGELSLVTLSLGERQAVNDLIDDAGVVFLNVPATLPWGVDACYVSFGNSEETRVVRFAGEPARVFKLPYVVVDRPVGGTQAQYVWADVVTKYASWQALMAANKTWSAVQAPTS